MTNSTDRISDMRETFLTAVDEGRTDKTFLLDMLNKLYTSEPDIKVPYEFTKETAIDEARVHWPLNRYYYRQRGHAGRNFSRERLEHLIEVREYLKEGNYEGFGQKPVVTVPPQLDTIFVPSANLNKFVRDGDLQLVRTALRVELDDNRISTAELRSSLKWANSQINNLCESYSEKAFARAIDRDPTHWTTEYYDGQIVYLKANFSEDRYLHLVNVRDELRKRKVDGFEPIVPASTVLSPAKHQQYQQSQSHHNSSSGSEREHNSMFTVALMIGGAIAALVVYLLAIGR